MSRILKALSILFLLPASILLADSNLKKSSIENICKATIASLMFKDPQIIKAKFNKASGIVALNYTRTSDQTNWKFKCKVSNSSILWGKAEGRWRDAPYDEKVTFKLKGSSEVEITLEDSDGAKTIENFQF